MGWKQKLALGATLVVLAAAALVVGPSFGFGRLGHLQDFFAGFVVGLVLGSGIALCVFGLIARREESSPGVR
jgi:hypothetical protein